MFLFLPAFPALLISSLNRYTFCSRCSISRKNTVTRETREHGENHSFLMV